MAGDSVYWFLQLYGCVIMLISRVNVQMFSVSFCLVSLRLISFGGNHFCTQQSIVGQREKSLTKFTEDWVWLTI